MVDDLNHLIALPLAEVVNYLKDNDYRVKIQETHPPYKKEGQGERRVLALYKGEKVGTINLIWSYEIYN